MIKRSLFFKNSFYLLTVSIMSFTAFSNTVKTTIIDPSGNCISIWKSENNWNHSVDDCQGNPILDYPILDVYEVRNDNTIVIEIENTDGYQVGRYRSVDSKTELLGKKIIIDISKKVQLIQIQPRARHNGPLEHTKAYGIPIVVEIKVNKIKLTNVKVSSTIYKNRSKICKIYLRHNGYGNFSGHFLGDRFMDDNPHNTTCYRVWKQANFKGGEYKIVTIVTGKLGNRSISRKIKKIIGITDEVIETALSVREPNPISCNIVSESSKRLNPQNRELMSLYPDEEFRGIFKVTCYDKLKENTSKIVASVHRNGIPINNTANLSHIGYGSYVFNLASIEKKEVGKYTISFALNGKDKASGLDVKISRPLFSFRVNDREPQIYYIFYPYDARYDHRFPHKKLYSLKHKKTIKKHKELDSGKTIDNVWQELSQIYKRYNGRCWIYLEGAASKDRRDTPEEIELDNRLSIARAEDVKNWLIENKKFPGAKIKKVYGIGQTVEERVHERNRHVKIQLFCRE